MENNLDTIVARQLQEAQDEHARALRIVKHIQLTLNRKTVLLERADNRLINIEEIHNNLPE